MIQLKSPKRKYQDLPIKLKLKSISIQVWQAKIENAYIWIQLMAHLKKRELHMTLIHNLV